MFFFDYFKPSPPLTTHSVKVYHCPKMASAQLDRQRHRETGYKPLTKPQSKYSKTRLTIQTTIDTKDKNNRRTVRFSDDSSLSSSPSSILLVTPTSSPRTSSFPSRLSSPLNYTSKYTPTSMLSNTRNPSPKDLEHKPLKGILRTSSKNRLSTIVPSTSYHSDLLHKPRTREGEWKNLWRERREKRDICEINSFPCCPRPKEEEWIHRLEKLQEWNEGENNLLDHIQQVYGGSDEYEKEVFNGLSEQPHPRIQKTKKSTTKKEVVEPVCTKMVIQGEIEKYCL
ncbi:hypothetical protein M231_01853 [Tremella mesenterica]|uniref:Uncharacterized protein n=1 Tax=Tremella mesenterica TaxID=5217 RepID=A0A4Q1BS25_TREME|nr:uncharacterized protein TREMEDRAFT_58331 [Tremella mesenterica DSM 1558]EIW72176.1 hypothetical protein TREMEDRAFT_58331 [Tremella mesenterica DSM 1558]RXK40794.1 hypothetical protein M231_01853 [Tremella mesenterica]